MTRKRPSKMVRDPIYNYVELFDEEVPVVDHPLMQRLRRIRQLQTTYLTYMGGEHSRFQHSLGVAHLAGEFERSISEDGEDLFEAVRFAGLLHDLGHGPFSHTFDEAVIMPSKELKDKGIRSHEDVGKRLIESSEIGDHLKDLGLYDTVISLLSEDPEKVPENLRPYHFIIKNWIYPADIMDFLLRDSYYTGAREYGTVDHVRLIQFSKVVSGEIGIYEKALEAFRNFVMSRYYMFNNVYFHPTCRATEFVVKEMLEISSDHMGFVEKLEKAVEGNYEEILDLVDDHILFKIYCEGKERGEMKRASELAKDLITRRIPWKAIYSTELRFGREDATSYKYFNLEEFKREILENAERELSKLGIPLEDVIIDHTRYKSLPDNPYEVRGEILVIGKDGSVGYKRIDEIVENFPMYRIKFKVYLSKKWKESFPEARRIFEKCFNEAVIPRTGVTM